MDLAARDRAVVEKLAAKGLVLSRRWRRGETLACCECAGVYSHSLECPIDMSMVNERLRAQEAA